jgi:toxin ParE1/3/4
MGRILQTRQAEEDLLEIWSYVADDNPAAADDLLDDIDATCAKLADAPYSGRLREELAPNIRSLPVGNYVIFYRPDEDGIVVIRVLHGARDLPGLL